MTGGAFFSFLDAYMVVFVVDRIVLLYLPSFLLPLLSIDYTNDVHYHNEHHYEKQQKQGGKVLQDSADLVDVDVCPLVVDGQQMKRLVWYFATKSRWGEKERKERRLTSFPTEEEEGDGCSSTRSDEYDRQHFEDESITRRGMMPSS